MLATGWIVVILFISSISAWRSCYPLTPRVRPLQGNSISSTTGTPLVSALLTIEPTLQIQHRFFFPGHSNAFIPPSILHGLHNTSGMFRYDLPELDGVDNIHCPEGPLLEALQLAAKYFKAYRTWFLVNGSTSGILAAILAYHRIHQQYRKPSSANRKSRFVLGRDAHKSVYNGVALAGCDAIVLPCHVDPDFQISLGINFDGLEEILVENVGTICGLVFTRPTYHGVGCSTTTLKQVITLCHQYGVPVLIDEAHGSHLHLLQDASFQDGLACGADVVVQSSHKTLTSLSQTAMMHLNHHAFSCVENLSTEIAGNILHNSFSMLTTTSPHVVLLASLDATRAHIQDSGQSAISQSLLAVQDLKSLRYNYPELLHILDESTTIQALDLRVDPLRLVVRFLHRNNQNMDDWMCESHGIYCELNEKSCITYHIPLFSDAEYLQPLYQALLQNLQRENARAAGADPYILLKMIPLNGVSTIYSESVLYQRPRIIRIEDALGHVSAETVSVYPPGIPLLISGEIILSDHISALQRLRTEALGSGISITGIDDPNIENILVV